MFTTIPPSPTPPWDRLAVAPIAQTLTEDGEASLTTQTTYLNQTAPKDVDDESVPYDVTLPDGTYNQQTKQFIIPATAVETTARWRVTGNFIDFVALEFDSVHQLAGLVWDGSRWHMATGNATKADS